MAKCGILLAFLFVGGFGSPVSRDEGPDFDEDMSIFFDHTLPDIEGRIVGGTVAAEGAFPWMVALINGATPAFVCGGSVLTNRHVLTAAHCIAHGMLTGASLSPNARVRVGTNRWNTGGQILNLQGFRNHPQYNQATIKNDIGILNTRANIVMNNRVRLTRLNTGFVGGNVPCRVSGWGRTVGGRVMSPVLLELRTTTVDGQRCVANVRTVSQQLNIRVPHVDPAIEICTFVAVNQGACQGDSGSALVLNSNNAQIGVVSWGLPCARGAPDIYVRISAFINWIRSVTG